MLHEHLPRLFQWPHILPALVLLRKPLFGLAKRQLPRTLCEMGAKLVY